MFRGVTRPGCGEGGVVGMGVGTAGVAMAGVGPEPLMPSAPESQFTSSEPVITAMPPTDQPAATNPESPVIDPNTDNNQPV